jgi:hypothetical protein
VDYTKIFECWTTAWPRAAAQGKQLAGAPDK